MKIKIGQIEVTTGNMLKTICYDKNFKSCICYRAGQGQSLLDDVILYLQKDINLPTQYMTMQEQSTIWDRIQVAMKIKAKDFIKMNILRKGDYYFTYLPR